MSILSKLKLSAATRSSLSQSSIEMKREKLLTNLDHQIKAAEADEKNEIYTYSTLRWVTHPETGDRVRQTAQAKVKPWWWRDPQGKHFTCVKYGNKKLELSKGKFAIEVGERTVLVPTLNQIAEAIRAGEFDDLISNAAVFGKKTK